jgi:hypothetical protein
MGSVRMAGNGSLVPNTSITVLVAGTGTPSPSSTKKAQAFEFVLTNSYTLSGLGIKRR